MRILSIAHGIVNNCLIWVLSRNFIRGRRIKRYLKLADKPKLQIGCGSNRLDGWLNVGISLDECWKGVYMDAGKRFPFPDESMNYIYSEHLFEHLTYQQAQNMLKESYRVLKPGGVMRVATPDLRFLLGLYQEPEKPLHKEYMEFSVKDNGMPASPVYVISRFHTNWGHQIIYDRETLTKKLEEVGFKDITSCEVGQSVHKELNGVEAHFKVMPYEFDLLETMIVEGMK